MASTDHKLYHTEGFKNLKDNLAAMKKGMMKNLPAIREEIEEVITSESKNNLRITHTLETLLGYMEMEVGEREFLQLNAYYEGVNKKEADFYKKEYEKYFNPASFKGEN